MAAAPRDAVKTVGRPGRVHPGFTRIRTVPVEAPLFDITMHIVQSPVVWRKHGYTKRHRLGIPAIFLLLLLKRRQTVGPSIERGRTARPAGIFPLRFGRQPIALSLLPVSYTHLDVYKRQVYIIARKNERTAEDLFGWREVKNSEVTYSTSKGDVSLKIFSKKAKAGKKIEIPQTKDFCGITLIAKKIDYTNE